MRGNEGLDEVWRQPLNTVASSEACQCITWWMYCRKAVFAKRGSSIGHNAMVCSWHATDKKVLEPYINGCITLLLRQASC